MRHILSPSAALFHADCRDALRQLPDNSIDSCVTDPPYALVSIVKRFGSPNAEPAKGNEAYMRASAGFMGKSWDTGECAMDPTFWVEVLRVLKPGAHVVAFGASRGYHRIACAIEDAGFEIRDSLMWLYGTGFPKSHDVSKGIDKAAGIWRGRAGAVKDETVGQVAKGTEYERTDKGEPATPEAAEWEGWGTALKPAFEPIVLARKPLSEPTVAANVLKWGTGALNIDGCRVGTDDNLNGGGYNVDGTSNKKLSEATSYATKVMDKVFIQPKGRWPANIVHDGSDEVVGAFPSTGASKARVGKRSGKETGTFGEFAGQENVSMGHDDAGGSAAREWGGWGTALKPAFEPIVLARKPLSEPTVAANVLRWRTGALNIGACRVGSDVRHNAPAGNANNPDTATGPAQKGGFGMRADTEGTVAIGRWPANVVHDDSDEVVGAFPNTNGSKRGVKDPNGSMGYHGGASGLPGVVGGYDDAGGSAARFFYSAKASKQDRNGSKHPTVKPISLMEWLCTLITPPGGTVLDPFAGSGTTGIAAQNKGFQVVLCEREAEYVTDIKARFAGSSPGEWRQYRNLRTAETTWQQEQ